jgi:hypothetical protein
MSSLLATPASSIRIAPSMYGTSSMLTMKPARSWALITVLPSDSMYSSARLATSGDDMTVVTISTRPMTGTGLKKWRPITRSGRVVAAAMRVIGIEEVLEARIESAGATVSRSAKICFFSSSSSLAASITS